MPDQTRPARFSVDPRASRDGGREHWIPIVPGESDFRPRSVPIATSPPREEQARRTGEEPRN